MDFKIIGLTDEQAEDIESRLDVYDHEHITYKLTGEVKIGLLCGGKLMAGAIGCMTVYKILYVSTVYVDERHRGKGAGRQLMEAVEEKARELGANIIRLDSFDWQGAEFYKRLGYEQAGYYENKEDGFSEYFFIKRL